MRINTLRPRQNGRHFADDIFKCIFLNENVKISVKISLKSVPMGPINNIPALVQIMAWRRPGDKVLWWLVYRRMYASLGLNELNTGYITTWSKFDGYMNYYSGIVWYSLWIKCLMHTFINTLCDMLFHFYFYTCINAVCIDKYAMC